MNVQSGKIIYKNGNKRKSLSFAIDRECGNADLRILTGIKILPRGKRVVITLSPSVPLKIEKVYLRCQVRFNPDDRIFLNGFQSWTESREYRTDESVPPLSALLKPLYAKHRLDHFGDYYFRKYSRREGKYHGYTYTYVRSSGDVYHFAGSAEEENGFTVFEYDVRKKRMDIVKDCGGLVIGENYRAFNVLLTAGSEEEVFDEYFSESGFRKGRAPLASGWTSWYQYFTGISHEIVTDNLNAFRKNKIPADIFQIDDGYQNAVGDWLKPNKKFPKGMKPVATEIRKAGMKPGLWLAPFICEKKSEIFRDHPDWIVKDGKGRPLVIGNNEKWSGHFYALDIRNAEVKKYLKEVFDTVTGKWGFEMVKLDFLYAACVTADETRTRGQAMSDGMKFLRKLAGEKLILGCGVPLASAFGLVEYCRVGCDVDTRWEYEEAAAVHYRERVSTVNTIADTIGRRHLDGHVFRNDPDAFILRHQDVRLTAEQKRTLFLVNQIFGSLLFTSDNVGKYNDAEMREFLSQFPLMEREILSVAAYEEVYGWKTSGSLRQALAGARPYQNLYEARFRIGGMEYVCYVNLGSRAVHVKMDKGNYFDNYRFEFTAGGKTVQLPPYGSACYSRYEGNGIEIAGSTGHLFSGCDIREFAVKKNNIVLKMTDKPKRKSVVYISLPKGMPGHKVNGKFVKSFTKEDSNLLRVAFE